MFTIQDAHEMTNTPADDGETMNICNDDGASCKKRSWRIIGKIERNLKVRSVAGWDEARQSQDCPGQVFFIYNDVDCASGKGTTTAKQSVVIRIWIFFQNLSNNHIFVLHWPICLFLARAMEASFFE